MKDSFGRDISYMRISVTDRCNLRCIHCMPAEGVELMDHQDILRYEEIALIAKEAAALGIRKIRLTGGEPLVRPGIESLVAMLSEIPGIHGVYLTTNAVLLEEKLPALLAAGLKGVNISLNAPDAASYKAFTGRDAFHSAMRGLHAALAAPNLEVKINCVPTKGREEELLRIAGIAKDTRAAIRFIELMPIGMGAKLQGLSKDELMALLQSRYGRLCPDPLGHRLGDETPKADAGMQKQLTETQVIPGPAEYVRFPGFQSDIGFISAMSCAFCESCNRIRLTADGKLKSCLAYPATIDIKSPARAGDTSGVQEAIASCILQKPSGHQFGKHVEESRLMSQIGG